MASVLMVSQPSVAGVAQCVIDWSVGLQERGWQVTVAAPPEGDLLRWCAESDVPSQPWPSERSPYARVMAETRSLANIISATDPEVVMLHSSKAGLDGRLLMRGNLPTVFVPHAWSFDAATGVAGRGALLWERLAARRWTNAIICVSQAEYRRGVSMGIRGDYHIARNGIDLEAVDFALGGVDRATLRADLDISPGTRLAVCVGRLAPQKGQDVLLDAWSRLTDVQHRRLLLVGDGPDDSALRAMAASDPTVVFAGGADRRTALRWLAAADVVVVPSRWEGMALVPLEALAVGSPVVASDVTGVSEAVDPTVGALVPADDPAKLATALASWLQTSEADLKEVRVAARSRAQQEFGMAATVDAVEAALIAAASGRR